MARVVTTVDGVIGLIEYEIEKLTNKLNNTKAVTFQNVSIVSIK